MKKLSKRALARIITFAAAGALTLALFTGGAISKAMRYERTAEAMYQKNLALANEHLSDLNDVILKGIYSESAADQSSMCADVWMNAYAAKNAISSLPISDIDMEKCYTFLSKAAEFSRASQKQLTGGKLLDERAHDTFLDIKRKTLSLAQSFEKIQKIYLATDSKISGGIDFSFAAPKTIATSSATSEGLNTINKNLSDSPKLIYDGPYSDAVNTSEAKMLRGEAKIDKAKATEIAERFFSAEKGTLRYSGSKKSNITSYCFTKGSAYAEITERGGKILSYNSNESPAKSSFSYKECLSAAQRYLQKAGYENMKCDYYESANHFYIMNFHAMEGDVNCYTDLIKLKVNAESGKVCGFDALAYLTHHQNRRFDFKLTAAQAQKSVSPYLQIASTKKALIPSQSEKEVLCYEFRCTSDEGNELLVFIDAATGKQADLLILQIGENSVLTK